VAVLVACESCDLLHEGVELGRGLRAACSRCGQRLYGSPIDSLERTLAFSISALVLLVIANVFPFLNFSLEGQSQENHIVTGVMDLFQSGFEPLAGLVLLTTILAPFLEIILNLWALIPLLLGFRFPGVVFAARTSARLSHWSMLEVYLLAVIVAVVKLAMMATVALDLGAYAFFGLIAMLTGARWALETDALWSRIEATQ
jgi:paraquat-inducible protein A